MGSGGLRDPEHRVDIRLEGVVELLVGEVGEVLDVHLLTSVVHDEVETAERLDRVVDQISAVRRVAEIAGNREHLHAGVLRDGGDALRVLFLLGKIRHHHVGTLASERDHGGSPDARVGSGDERLAAP